MIRFRIPFSHRGCRRISVPAWTDTSTDYNWTVRPDAGSDFLKQADGLAIGQRQFLARVAEPGSPVAAGSPGGALQNESSVQTARQQSIRLDLFAKRGDAGLFFSAGEKRRNPAMQALRGKSGLFLCRHRSERNRRRVGAARFDIQSFSPLDRFECPAVEP